MEAPISTTAEWIQIRLRINSDAVARAPPVIACWTSLSLAKLPSPTDRRAPVTAPPIAAFFCHTNETYHQWNVQKKYEQKGQLHYQSFLASLLKETVRFSTQSCTPRAFSKEYSTPAYTPATVPAQQNVRKHQKQILTIWTIIHTMYYLRLSEVLCNFYMKTKLVDKILEY